MSSPDPSPTAALAPAPAPLSTTDYTTMSPDELIARIHALEARVHTQKTQLAAARHKPQARHSPPRPGRVFDTRKYTTRYVALKIAYLGRRYNGFEHHANNPTRLPTVEEELWRALVKTKLIFKSAEEGVSWEGCEYSKAGRTDKGVSAFGNVVALRVRSARPPPPPEGAPEASGEDSEGGEEKAEEKPFDHIYDELPYPRLLNRVLPPDIRVLAWCPSMPADFSARFSCRLRKYRYFFTQPAYCPAPGAQGLANRRHGGAEREGWLHIEAMQDAAARFEGLHDFRNFCKQDPARQITNFDRRVDRARVVEVDRGELGLPFLAEKAVAPNATGHAEPKLYAFEVWGSAFLWHQVRHMVAAIFLVGQGLEEPSIIDELLDAVKVSEKPLYEMSDDHPLVLWDCVFPDLEKGGMENTLEWILPDDPVGANAFSGGGNGRYGINGINEVLWTSWRRAKIDEVLVGQLLNVVASQRVGPGSSPLPDDADALTRGHSTRMFDGSEQVKHKGTYVPVMKKGRQEAPEVLNARWLERFPEKKRTGQPPPAEADVDE